MSNNQPAFKVQVTLSETEKQVIKAALLGLPPGIGINGLGPAETRQAILGLLKKLKEKETGQETNNNREGVVAS